jgi:hypothetical protein
LWFASCQSVGNSLAEVGVQELVEVLALSSDLRKKKHVKKDKQSRVSFEHED